MPTHIGTFPAETKAIAMAAHWVGGHGVPGRWAQGTPDASRGRGLARLLRGQDGHQLPSPGASTGPGPESPGQWTLWEGGACLTAVRAAHSLAFRVRGPGTCSVSSSEAEEGQEPQDR